MAELATIARPYAEALFQSAGAGADAGVLSQQLRALADLAADPTLRRFADDPKIDPAQVYHVVAGKTVLEPKIANLLRLLIANGRLAALPEVCAQFIARVKALSGSADAVIHSAYPIDAAQLAAVVATLEKRFARQLSATVVIDESLIGGIRVVVGDEVLDTSVKARLENMKLALTA